MKHARIFSIFSTLIFCAMFVVAGCSSSSSPSGTTSNPAHSVKPQLGSTFTDSISQKNSSLANQPGYSLTYTLVDTNATVGGKSGVYLFTSEGIDTLYYYYETNGDVAVYIDFSAGGYDAGQEWVTVPFASQDSSSIPTFKSFVIGDTVTISGYTKGTGTSTQTVADTSRYVEGATMSSQAASAVGTVPGTVSATYVPSIGFVVYQNTTETGTVLGQNVSGGQTIFLTSYTLK